MLKKRYANVQFEKINPNLKYQLKSYQFATDIDGLKQGDCLVVDTANGPTVAYFIEYSDIPKFEANKYKWVIQLVDMGNHSLRLQNEKRLNNILGKMEVRRKELEEIRIFQILAKEDKDMEKLLNEYNELSF